MWNENLALKYELKKKKEGGGGREGRMFREDIFFDTSQQKSDLKADDGKAQCIQ